MKVVIRKDNFCMKVVFIKDNFHVFFQIKKKKIIWKLSFVKMTFIFFFLAKHVKVVFCKYNYRLKILLKVVFLKDDFQPAYFFFQININRDMFGRKTIKNTLFLANLALSLGSCNFLVFMCIQEWASKNVIVQGWAVAGCVYRG